MVVKAGTSGFSYKAWKGLFYPEGLADAQMLEYYATRLPAVELNNTFYRMPSAKLIDRWRSQVPESFSFVLKATRRITHHAQLADVEDTLSYLLETASGLGKRLGAHLFQLPPYLRKDVDRLGRFLELVPKGQRSAFEFRHPSWFEADVLETLRSHDAALVVADGGKIEVPFEVTASWGYLRMRRDEYGADDLQTWAERARAQQWSDVYVFFKHEDDGAGPRWAEQFLTLTR